jgi:hypothetical protein
MRKSLVHAFAGLMAAASLTAFAMPTYAAAAERSDAEALQGWCDVVPAFCGGCNTVNARCRPNPNPCQVTADRNARDEGICAAKND